MMVTVKGSKNGFDFGPDQLQIPDKLSREEQSAAVLDALLRADDPDGLESMAPQSPPGGRHEGQSPREQAIEHGLTALEFRAPGGKSVTVI
jgi:hypothetical protein